MKDNYLRRIVVKTTQEKEQKISAEKRRKYFQEIGRKGGLKTKSNSQLTKVISFRLTDMEYKDSISESQKYNLRLSTYARLRYLEKTINIKEFESDEFLLTYGNSFIRINNLLRHRQWNMFENKKRIMDEIEEVLRLIKNYLYSKIDRDE
ncbi:special sigma factor [Chryseobacterium sp. H3056]|uniref:Special sigma factor n=1 Tax=Kaistella daneshvariae TaxID=2487074 RepID=A0A3N0WTE4_9FLAO|nr:special sigma factor [Kaistella daneshvariae]ROI08377.1 special sigma factor [Kaistella daneshvariae]